MDFNVAEEEQFSPNKLRAQIERLYMGAVGVSVQVFSGNAHSYRYLALLCSGNTSRDSSPGGNQGEHHASVW